MAGETSKNRLGQAAPRGPAPELYPHRYLSHETTSGGLKVCVRPVQPKDAPLYQKLFSELSLTSVYFRFFCLIKELTPEMLARLTRVDHQNEIALAAFTGRPDGERLAGVARVMSHPEGHSAEFAVLVGDAWQGRGVGALLLSRCLEVARARGMARVWGMVMPRNTQMLALAKKLGFTVKRDPESGEYLVQGELSGLTLPPAGGEAGPGSA